MALNEALPGNRDSVMVSGIFLIDKSRHSRYRDKQEFEWIMHYNHTVVFDIRALFDHSLAGCGKLFDQLLVSHVEQAILVRDFIWTDR